MMTLPPALEFTELESGYDEATVIVGVNLKLGEGEIITILGKNGMGKSTLLKTIMGFIPISKGSVQIGGEEVTGKKPYYIARHSVAYTPQEYTLFQDLTVEENLRLGVSNDRMLADGLDLITEYFPIIPERFKQKAGTLSGGEQRMLLVSRALISKPRLMLIDEISEGLQPTMVERVANVLKAARRDLGVAILLVEQNLDFALSIADRYAVLKLGEIVDRGNVCDDNAKNKIRTHLQV
jgi:ABC-type branched-subunit amino acid transport system ATPase component